MSLSKEIHIKCSEHSITLEDFVAEVLALLLCNSASDNKMAQKTDLCGLMHREPPDNEHPSRLLCGLTAATVTVRPLRGVFPRARLGKGTLCLTQNSQLAECQVPSSAGQAQTSEGSRQLPWSCPEFPTQPMPLTPLTSA